MARNNGAVCRFCRREGVKLFLKGAKCSAKCVMNKKNSSPGQSKAKMRGKPSEYNKRLREKQKARQYIGVLEKQFRRYFNKAERMKGLTGENLLSLLETRLDNVCRCAGFSGSIRGARQLVSHGHVIVNGSRINIPSYHVKPGDSIQISEKMKNNPFVSKSMEDSASKNIPSWLEFKKNENLVKVVKMPERSEMSIPVNEQLIVELYSK